MSQQLLRQMVKKGAAISYEQGPPVPLAFAEIDGKKLAWVTLFPFGPQDGHRLPFDKLKQVGKLGLGFMRKGKLKMYVAPFDQWPNLDTDLSQSQLQEWLQHLKTPKNYRAFMNFVDIVKQQ